MRRLLRLASAGVILAGSLLLVPAITAHTVTASTTVPDPAAAERAPLAAVISAALAECEAGDCYGAIATSHSTHHWGYVYNESSRAAAEAGAVAQWGGGAGGGG